MVEQDRPDPLFDAMTARLLHREALRRAADELNTTSGPGLEGVLARISAEVTAEASRRASGTDTEIVPTPLAPARPSPVPHQRKP
jgi:hypothetical protein